MSSSAFLYMADAELANDLRKLTKATKNDQAHPGQLVYVHWINCVNDSRSIIRQYGLMPDIKKSDDLKDMFPPMSIIYDYLGATNGGDAKQACNGVTQHFFKNLTIPSKRTLTKQAFYRRRSSLLIYHKLMHACALKTLKPNNKTTPFLAAGLYIGCKTRPKDYRNSLCYRKGDGPENERVVDKFNLFQLTSNEVYLSPLSSAAHIFKTKSSYDADNTKQRRKHGSNVNKWKTSNENGIYVAMPLELEDVGNEASAKGSGVAKGTAEDDSKAFTKTRFKKPMGKLGKELQKCKKNLTKIGKVHLLSDVLVKYNTIQVMVGHGLLFDRLANDDEEEEDVDGDEEDSEDEGEGNNYESSSDESTDSSASSGSDGNDDDKDQDDAKNEDALAALYDYIEHLNGKVIKAKMTGAEIQIALGLKRTPNFRRQKEKSYFCSLKSDDMKCIKKLYKGDDSSEEVIAAIAEKKWLQPLVKLMRALNWSDSIDGLPDNNSIGEETSILLWNVDDDFVDMFMQQEDPDHSKISHGAC